MGRSSHTMRRCWIAQPRGTASAQVQRAVPTQSRRRIENPRDSLANQGGICGHHAEPTLAPCSSRSYKRNACYGEPLAELGARLRFGYQSSASMTSRTGSPCASQFLVARNRRVSLSDQRRRLPLFCSARPERQLPRQNTPGTRHGCRRRRAQAGRCRLAPLQRTRAGPSAFVLPVVPFWSAPTAGAL